MDNKNFYKVLIGAIFVLIVVGILLFVNMTNPGINDSGGHSPTAANGSTDARQGQESPTVGQVNVNDLKVEAQEGGIQFYPDGGEYTGRVRIQLALKPLRSSRGDIIASYICYTVNGTDPSRTNGKRYSRGDSIHLKREGTFTLKARLVSKVGEYEGNVYSRVYTIKPETLQVSANQPTAAKSDTTQASPDTTSVSQPGEDTVKITTAPSNPPPETRETRETPLENKTITNFYSLDTNTKDEIRESMNRITIEVEGIESIKKTGDLKLHLAISKEGAAKVLDISGFEVQPAEKMAEIRKALNLKIGDVTFAPPTMNENPVDVEIWVDFKKIAKFFEKIIFER